MCERFFFRRAAFGALVLLLLAGLGACGSDEDKAKEGSTPAKAAAPAPPAPAAEAPAAAEPEPALSPEERARAERALDFHNAAMSALEEGYYSLPDALYTNAGFYLKTWRLPRRPAITGSRESARARLKPPAALFSESDAATLTSALDGMDKALDALLGRYKALEGYVGDQRIRDDGARGKALAAKLAEDHAVFMAARKTWLEIVEARAAEAEAALLREHPLRRQITAAGAIFTCYAEVAAALGADDARPAGDPAAGAAAGSPAAQAPGAAAARASAPGAANRAELERVLQELESLLAEAARPPFAAAPELERRYRAFLKEATAYAAALKLGLAEGFFVPQRRELNMAAVRSRAAYNDFVRAANGVRAR